MTNKIGIVRIEVIIRRLERIADAAARNRIAPFRIISKINPNTEIYAARRPTGINVRALHVKR